MQALAKCTFSIATKDSGFLVQTASEKELNEWLYAINPLLAGQIRCVHRPEQSGLQLGEDF